MFGASSRAARRAGRAARPGREDVSLREIQKIFGYRGRQWRDTVHLTVLAEEIEGAPGVEEGAKVRKVLFVSLEGVDHRLVHERFEGWSRVEAVLPTVRLSPVVAVRTCPPSRGQRRDER